MILSISRRTDIPACYSPWLSNRFKEGVVYVRNPYDRHLVSSVDLHRSVDGIVFWSKDPRPMFEYLPQFDLIPFYVQFTLNGYGRELEPHVPDPVQLLETFRVLSDRIGPHRVIWRYDPVIITDEYTCAYHKQTFDTLSAALQGYTETCVISFLDIGRKNRQQMQAAGVQEITTDRVLELASFMAGSGASHGMTIQSCAEPYDLSSVGISMVPVSIRDCSSVSAATVSISGRTPISASCAAVPPVSISAAMIPARTCAPTAMPIPAAMSSAPTMHATTSLPLCS